VPTNPSSVAQQNARARLATYSQGWASLTAAQQQAWKLWGVNNPIIDALGAQQELTGQAAYIKLNTRLAQATDTAISLPPTEPAPTGLVTMSITADIGAGTCEIAFTATPLGANDRLWVQAAKVNSAGITYVRNLLRVIVITAKAQATAYDYQSDLEAVFGSMQVDDYVHVWCSVFDSATGLLSTPLSDSAVVVST
jgi:hypothetical protein